MYGSRIMHRILTANGVGQRLARAVRNTPTVSFAVLLTIFLCAGAGVASGEPTASSQLSGARASSRATSAQKDLAARSAVAVPSGLRARYRRCPAGYRLQLRGPRIGIGCVRHDRLLKPTCASGYHHPPGKFSCERNASLSDIATALYRDQFGFSSLAINLAGVAEFGEGPSKLAWRDRYDRISRWLQQQPTAPDIIALQEVEGYLGCPLQERPTAADNETILHLLAGLPSRRGVHYRVANVTVTGAPQGACTLLGGKAVIYNADRLRNLTHRLARNPVQSDTTLQSSAFMRATATRAHIRLPLTAPCASASTDRRSPHPTSALTAAATSWARPYRSSTS